MLASPSSVAQIAVQREGLPVAGGGGPVVAGRPLQDARIVQCVGLPGLIRALARGGDCGLLQSDGLIPVTPSKEKAADRGGNGDGMAV